MKIATLYLIATPIGNLEDISLRALRILKEVDLIACEDTRWTVKLLNHYGIRVPRESHHQHNEAESTPRLVALLKQGRSVALVSDAGTPSISDPGRILVSACRREGLRVETVPGPSAAIAALAGSGLPAENFFFAGFLPPRGGQRRKRLEELASIPATLVLYEAPHRLEAALEDILAQLGPRRACLARELTKVHEEWLAGSLDEILVAVRSRARIQGEITLVIDRGKPAEARISGPPSIARHLEEEMRRTGASRNEALKSVARQRGVSRKEAYRQLLAEKG